MGYTIIMDNQSHSISFKSILKVVGVLVGIYFLYFIKDLLLILFLAMILASLIKPVANWFRQHKMPAAFGVIIVYIVLIGSLVGAISILSPALLKEAKALFGSLDEYIKNAGQFFSRFEAKSDLLDNLSEKIKSITSGDSSNILGQLVATVRGFFGGVVSGVLVLVIAFYLVIEEDGLKKMARGIIPPAYYGNFVELAVKIQQKVGAWLRGQLLLGLIVGTMAYVGLLILGIPNALVLAFIAGLTEMVPYIGPIFGAIPAVLLALAISPIKGLSVVILYFIIQQTENHLLVPKVMQKTIGINPVISILALATGFKLGGVVGALISLPVVAAVEVILREHIFERMHTQAALLSSSEEKQSMDDSFGPTL